MSNQIDKLEDDLNFRLDRWEQLSDEMRARTNNPLGLSQDTLMAMDKVLRNTNPYHHEQEKDLLIDRPR